VKTVRQAARVPSKTLSTTGRRRSQPRLTPGLKITIELGAAQLPQILGVDDAGDGSKVGSRSGEPPCGDQDLSRGQDAHNNSMGTCGAR
jgi:hypothetical protein